MSSPCLCCQDGRGLWTGKDRRGKDSGKGREIAKETQQSKFTGKLRLNFAQMDPKHRRHKEHLAAQPTLILYGMLTVPQ